MENVNTRQRTFLSLSILGYGIIEFNSREFHLHFTFKASWNNRDDVWKNANYIHVNNDVFATAVVFAKAPLKAATTPTATPTKT